MRRIGKIGSTYYMGDTLNVIIIAGSKMISDRRILSCNYNITVQERIGFNRCKTSAPIDRKGEIVPHFSELTSNFLQIEPPGINVTPRQAITLLVEGLPLGRHTARIRVLDAPPEHRILKKPVTDANYTADPQMGRSPKLWAMYYLVMR